MSDYAFYALGTSPGKVSWRLTDLPSRRWTQAGAATFLRDYGIKNYSEYVGVLVGVYRLPDDFVEREALLGLSGGNRILAAPTRYSQKAYMVLSPWPPGPDVDYISGWYRTQAEAFAGVRALDKVIVVHFKGSRLTLSGAMPLEPEVDIFSEGL